MTPEMVNSWQERSKSLVKSYSTNGDEEYFLVKANMILPNISAKNREETRKEK